MVGCCDDDSCDDDRGRGEREDVLEVRRDGVLMGCADRVYGCQLLHII